MITVNMHEAKTRLSELVQSVERGDEVMICRNGKPVVRLPLVAPAHGRRNLEPDPALVPTFAPAYDPAEPLSDDEWPEDCR